MTQVLLFRHTQVNVAGEPKTGQFWSVACTIDSVIKSAVQETEAQTAWVIWIACRIRFSREETW